MAARAMWKGVIRIGGSKVPVKLYSAVQDKSIRFRLLHEKDLEPVKQQMVDPVSGEPVDYKEVKKAFPVTKQALVVLDDEELETLEPKESRDIEVTRFVKDEEIDHRWYERAYYLGPDESSGDYFALAQALEKTGREGVARWVMRRKNYVGSLRAEDGYLMLIALRHADEVVSVDQLEAPTGRPLSAKELKMAQQLVEALSGKFDPSEFRDDYRDRVMELIEAKAKGSKVKLKKFRPKPVKDESLDRVLEASLAGAKRKAS